MAEAGPTYAAARRRWLGDMESNPERGCIRRETSEDRRPENDAFQNLSDHARLSNLSNDPSERARRRKRHGDPKKQRVERAVPPACFVEIRARSPTAAGSDLP